MSTKTIAVDSQVYERLAAIKREGESFSKVIDRLIAEVGEAHTGADILRGLATIDPLSEEDAQAFVNVISDNRASQSWLQRDLR